MTYLLGSELGQNTYIGLFDNVPPMPEKHYQWYYQSDGSSIPLLDDPDNLGLIQLLTRMCGTFPLSIEYATQAHVTLALSTIGGVTGSKIGLVCQPFEAMRAAGTSDNPTPATNWGLTTFKVDIDNLLTRVSQKLGWGLSAANVGAICIDYEEWDSTKRPPSAAHDASHLAKFMLVQRILADAFPGVPQVWYGFGGQLPAATNSGWASQTYFPPGFDGGLQTASLYYLNEWSLCQQILRRVMANGKQTVPFVGLGGFVQRTPAENLSFGEWAEASYPNSNSYQAGLEINDFNSFVSNKSRRDRFWDSSLDPFAWFWPAPFKHASWQTHFWQYCRGAAKL